MEVDVSVLKVTSMRKNQKMLLRYLKIQVRRTTLNELRTSASTLWSLEFDHLLH